MLFRNTPWSARKNAARSAALDTPELDDSHGTSSEVDKLQSDLDEFRAQSESRIQELETQLQKACEERDIAQDMLKSTEALLMETIEALSHARADVNIKDATLKELQEQIIALTKEPPAPPEKEEPEVFVGRHFKTAKHFSTTIDPES